MRLAANNACLAEQILPTRMSREPFPQDGLSKGRQRNSAACPLAPGTLLFTEEDRSGHKIYVIDPQSQEFAAPGSRMGGQTNHRIDEWLRGMLEHISQQFFHLSAGEEQALP